jgi:hypothetical protein
MSSLPTEEHCVVFEALTAVVIKSSIFWDIMPCILLTFNGLHGVISEKIELFIPPM